MLPRLGRSGPALLQNPGECEVGQIDGRHVVVEKQGAADPNPDHDVGKVADDQKRPFELGPLAGAYRGYGYRGETAPPEEWISATPDGRDLSGLGKILPVSYGPQHQRPAPPGRGIRMGRGGDAALVPDDLLVVVGQVLDTRPPAEEEMRKEHPDVSNRCNGTHQQ